MKIMTTFLAAVFAFSSMAFANEGTVNSKTAGTASVANSADQVVAKKAKHHKKKKKNKMKKMDAAAPTDATAPAAEPAAAAPAEGAAK